MAKDASSLPVPLTAEPATGQLVEHEGKIYTTVKEGKAYILVPPNARTSVDPQAKSKADGTQTQNVFYNPIQQFNRDLSVLAIKAFGADLCLRKRQRHEQLTEKAVRKKGNKRRRVEPPVEGENGTSLGAKRKRMEEEEGATADSDQGRAKLHDVGEAKDAGLSAAHTAADTVTHDTIAQVAHHAAIAAETVEDTPQKVPLELTEKPLNALETNGMEVHDPNTEESTDSPQKVWQPRFRILDALSATGLRALRYASEIPFTTAVAANDRDKNAVSSIKLNAEYNKLSSAITATVGDAQGHMYSVAFPSPHSHGPHHINGKYDVIDLDPYGTAAPFLDAALQALDDGGLLCVTCTDSGVFASCGYSEKTFSLYGGMPVKGNHSHEAGLRLILHAIATSAARHGISIEPLLSLSIDFYVRLFVRVRRSAQDVKFLAGKTVLVYSCDHGCGAWSTQCIGKHNLHKDSKTNWKFSIAQAPSADRLCEHCGSKTHLAGPMWGGLLHNSAFVEAVLSEVQTADKEIYQTTPRLEGVLTTALDELLVNSPPSTSTSTSTPDPSTTQTPGDPIPSPLIPATPPQTLDHHPFFLIPSALCKILHCTAPPETLIKGALRHAGYIATRSHCKPGSIKTNAPWSFVWEVFREWVRVRAPVKEGVVREGMPGWKIMQTAGEEREGDKQKVVFDERLGREEERLRGGGAGGKKKLVRYQQNPMENWGPMVKAKGSG